MLYEAFWELPREIKIDIVAEYEARWRIEALQRWEIQQQAELEMKRKQQAKGK